MTGIPGLGGHPAPSQRTLTDLAGKALADDAASGVRAAPSGTVRGTSVPRTVPAPREEALLLELSDDVVELLADTADTADPADPAGAPAASEADAAPPARPGCAATPDPMTPRQAVGPAQVRGLPLDQLVAVLRRSGTDFRQAVRILANVELDRPLPGKATLRAMWDDAAPSAAGPRDRPETSAEAGAVYDTPLDRLVRDRAWHRANPQAEPGADPSRADPPTLRTVVVPAPATQVYVAGLTTAEYQRLVVLLGESTPDWFAGVRRSRGVRALMEMRGIARLNVARFAGLRLGGWALGAAGIAIAWVVGVRTGSWW